MALPLVTLTYTVPVKGGKTSDVAAALASVPLPLRMLFDLGVYVVSDLTPNAAPAVRTIVLRINSADPPTATAKLVRGQSASGIIGTTVTHIGTGLIKPPAWLVLEPASQTLAEWLEAPPKVDSPPGRGCRLASYMKIVGVTNVDGGAGYSSQTTANLIGGFPKGLASDVQDPDPINPLMAPSSPEVFLGSSGVGTRTRDPHTQVSNELGNVGSVAILDPGIGYDPATTTIAFLGDPPLGRPAKAFATFDAMGRITNVIMTDSGVGYLKAPTPVARDTTRDTTTFGAKLSANMLRGVPATFHVATGDRGAITVTLVDGGDGYTEIPGDGSLVIYDPTGGGAGAIVTVGPVVNGAASQFGLSRIDVLNTGSAYIAPALSERSFFENLYLVSEAKGGSAKQDAVVRFFGNMMKTAIQNVVLTEVAETVA
jgi:hypothetical protein